MTAEQIRSLPEITDLKSALTSIIKGSFLIAKYNLRIKQMSGILDKSPSLQKLPITGLREDFVDNLEHVNDKARTAMIRRTFRKNPGIKLSEAIDQVDASLGIEMETVFEGDGLEFLEFIKEQGQNSDAEAVL